MKKIIFLLIYILSLDNFATAQNTFEKILSNPEDQVINSIIEYEYGNFIMVGRIKNKETNQYNGYLLKIDSTGEVIQESIISPNDTVSCTLFNVHYFGNFYFLLGAANFDEIIKLWYLRLNSNLEITDEQFLFIPNDRWISYMNSVIDSDTNLIIAGYTSRMDAVYINNSDPFFYKVDINGKYISSNFHTTSNPFDRAFDVIESPDNLSYYAFLSHFSYSGGQKLIMNRNFDVIDVHSLPLDVYDAKSPIKINEYDLLLCGKGSPPQSTLYALNVITVNDRTELIDHNYFKINDNMREMPAYSRCVSKLSENIYIGGTSNIDYYNPFFSTLDSWFHLVKIDTDITPIWERWYGGDAYYHLYSILATQDGGCIMVGNRYDYETQEQERDIYIVKVDIEGNIVWVQEIAMGETVLSIYPNPGQNQIFIDIKFSEQLFELINANGRVALSQLLNSGQNIVNTELLKPGVYFYRISGDSSKSSKSGKWIKN
jgi:hypothetical protein